MKQDGGGSGGDGSSDPPNADLSRRDSGGFFSWNRSHGMQVQEQRQQQQQQQQQVPHGPIQQMTMPHQQLQRNHSQPSYPTEEKHEDDHHVSPTPFRPMQPREFSLGGNLQRYRTLSMSGGQPLQLPLTLPADVGGSSGTTSVLSGLVAAIHSRVSKMGSPGTGHDNVDSGNAEKAHPHHDVDLHGGDRDRKRNPAATSENRLVETNIEPPRPALARQLSSVSSRRSSIESKSIVPIVEEENSADDSSPSSSRFFQNNMREDYVDASGEESEEKAVSFLQRLQQQQQSKQYSQASFSLESLGSINLLPSPQTPDNIIADVAASSDSLIVFENVEEEEVAEKSGKEVAVGPARLSSFNLSKKRPAEVLTTICEDITSPSRREITTTTPISISTISPNEAKPSAATDTATARFGRLLQECRDLAETCDEAGSETPSLPSSGMNSLLQMKTAAAKAAASNLPVSFLQREIDTSNDDTMKMMRESQLTMDPALFFSTGGNGDSYCGSMNFQPSALGRKLSNVKPSTNSSSFERLEVLTKVETSNVDKSSERRPTSQRTLYSRSLMSDLSLGVDLMYGDNIDEETSAMRLQEDDETASSESAEYKLSDLEKFKSVPSVSDLSEHPEKMIQIEVEHKKEKVVTEESHPAILVNEMNEANTHGRPFRSQEMVSPRTYSWLKYTTNSDNEDSLGKKSTPEKSMETMGVPRTKKSPLENDELIFPENSIENASNHSTEFSEVGGDGLLVGFGRRPKAVHIEDSSISSSDSSSSSGSGDSSSYGSGSSRSGSSGSESSGSEISSGESSTSSEDSSSFPALARHGLHITQRRDSDVVSELSFGGASALMALQAMKSPVSRNGTPTSEDGTQDESGISAPSLSSMGTSIKSSPENQNQKINAGDTKETQRSIKYRPRLPPPEQTRLAMNRDRSRRASSGSRDPTRSSNMDPFLEKLDELSESNASFLDDVSSILEPNKAVQTFLSKPAPSDCTSNFSSQCGHEFEEETVQKFLVSSDCASSRTSQKSHDSFLKSSITSDPSKVKYSTFKYMSSSFPAQPFASTDQVKNANSLKSNNAKHSPHSKSLSTLSREQKNSNASIGSGSIYSDIVARAIALKSSGVSNTSVFSGSSISTSTSLSHHRKQQSLTLGGGGQHAGIKTTESFRSIHKEGANSIALIAQTSTAVLANEDITTVDSKHQSMQQGSGESPLENINHNMNDDLSSMSSVVSRARNPSRDIPIIASPTRSVVNIGASSTISSAQNPPEENVEKMTQHRLMSESVEVSGEADKGSKHEMSGSQTENALLSVDDVKKKTSMMGPNAVSRLSMKSGDDISFAYEDFPTNRRSTSFRTLPTNLEIDSKKPWKTAPRETSVGKSSNCDSQSSRGLKLEEDTEFQQPLVESGSDGSVELFESSLKKMGLYEELSVSDKDEDCHSTASYRKLKLEQDTEYQQPLVASGSDESVELFKSSLKRMGLYEELSTSDKDEVCHSTVNEHPEVLISSQHDTVSANTDEYGNYSEKNTRSSLKDVATAAQEMADLLRSSIISRQLTMNDNSSSHSSERSETSLIKELKSFQKSYEMTKRSDSHCAGGKENMSDDGDNSHRSASELRSSLGSDNHEFEHELSGIKRSVNDIFLIKSPDEESLQSENNINAMLKTFKKRGSAIYGDSTVDYTPDQIFQQDTMMDKISMSSSASPLSIEHANDEDIARNSNHLGTTRKSLCCQRGVNCQKSRPCCTSVIVVVVVITIVIGIAVNQLMKKNPTQPSQLEPKPPTEAKSPTSLPTLQPPNWMQVAGDLVGESSGDEAGFSVSASKDGKRVIIGARRNQKDEMKNRGAARIYQLDDVTGSYVPIWDIYGEAAGDVSLVHERV
jgi:hypothetical protein